MCLSASAQQAQQLRIGARPRRQARRGAPVAGPFLQGSAAQRDQATASPATSAVGRRTRSSPQSAFQCQVCAHAQFALQAAGGARCVLTRADPRPLHPVLHAPQKSAGLQATPAAQATPTALTRVWRTSSTANPTARTAAPASTSHPCLGWTTEIFTQATKVGGQRNQPHLPSCCRTAVHTCAAS